MAERTNGCAGGLEGKRKDKIILFNGFYPILSFYGIGINYGYYYLSKQFYQYIKNCEAGYTPSDLRFANKRRISYTDFNVYILTARR